MRSRFSAACGLVAAHRRRLAFLDGVLSGRHARPLLPRPNVESGPFSPEFTLALRNRRELLREVRGRLRTLLTRRLELERARIDVTRKLREPGLLGNEHGPRLRHLAPFSFELVELDPEDDLALLCLGAGSLHARGLFVVPRLAKRYVASGSELSLVRLDLMLERLAELSFSLECRFELTLDGIDAGWDELFERLYRYIEELGRQLRQRRDAEPALKLSA